MSMRRSTMKWFAVAILFLFTTLQGADGQKFSQTGVIGPVFSLEAGRDLRETSNILTALFDVRGGDDDSTSNNQQQEPAIYTRKSSSSCKNNKYIGWKRNRLFSNAISLRGGVDVDKADERKAVDSSEASDVQSKANEASHNDFHISADLNTKHDGSKVNEGSGKFQNFFSFFRPIPSTPPAAAAVLTIDQSKAIRIPHGPTGGGSTILAARSEIIQEDTNFLMTSNEFGAPTNVNNQEAPNTTTYPAAFVTNHGPSLASIEKIRGSQDKIQPNDVPNKSDTVSNHSQNPHEKSKSSNDSSIVVEDKRNDATTALTTNETQRPTLEEESEILNVTSNVMSNYVQSTNVSFPNASVLHRLAQECKHDYTSSGYWTGIDLIASFGFSTLSDDLKISKVLRPVRKAVAKSTGLHGFLSGKPSTPLVTDPINAKKKRTIISIDEELGIHDSSATEAELAARRIVRPLTRRQRRMERIEANRNRGGRRWGFRRGQQNNMRKTQQYIVIPVIDESPDAVEQRRRKRVEEIDELLKRGSARLLELQCEKDDLQRAPNPLFNYTKQYDESANKTFGDVRTSREFNFPPDRLVEEYIDDLVSHGRLIRLNHTDLWQSQSNNNIDDDEIIGDDLFTPSGDAKRLYQNIDQRKSIIPTYAQNSGGSWLLRTGFGNGGSIGEKLGETIETQAYKAVCNAVMSILARILSALHGINVMSHSDIRLYVEQDPDLPPVDKTYDKDNYAQQAIRTAMQKGAKKKRKSGGKSPHHPSRRHGHELSEDAFIQRDAVVETLISHCQISAPLLKLFPIDWQRAIVGNIITLVTAIVSDFADGIQIQLLGHSLSFSFKPITEADIFQNIGTGGFRQNHRRSRPDEFEYAVWATAQDISSSLSFLDGWLGWLEKKIGGGILISQLSNLIARVVLTLIDEVLSGARLDLWSSQANGPRLFAALEYRTSSISTDDSESIT